MKFLRKKQVFKKAVPYYTLHINYLFEYDVQDLYFTNTKTLKHLIICLEQIKQIECSDFWPNGNYDILPLYRIFCDTEYETPIDYDIDALSDKMNPDLISLIPNVIIDSYKLKYTNEYRMTSTVKIQFDENDLKRIHEKTI